MAGKRGIATYNIGDPVLQDGSKKAIRREFARRLQERMASKNLNQSELARKASDHLSEPMEGQKQGHSIGRDAISHYINAVSLPRPEFLRAISKALACSPSDLIPESPMKNDSKIRFVMTQQYPNGMVKVDAAVPMSIAAEWLKVLNRVTAKAGREHRLDKD
jgi:transcriptional regulator with XRE-family HTH domain